MGAITLSNITTVTGYLRSRAVHQFQHTQEFVMKKKCISSVLHRQLGVEDGLPLQTSQRVAKSSKVKMHTMLKSKNGVLYRCSICSCVAALSSSDALNEKGPGIQQTEESTEATEQPSHSSDNLQDPDRVFTFTAASVEDDVKRMPKEIRALLAFEIAKAERQEIIHKAHDLTTKTGVDNLAHLSSKQFLQDVNRVLTQFLFGLYGAKFGDFKRNSDAYRVAHTNKKWLAELSSETPERVSESDVVAVFDNNQVLQRRWGIAVGNKACASIVTMTMFIKHQAEVAAEQTVLNGISSDGIDATCHIQVKKRARKCPNCQQFFAAMRLESQQAPSTSNPKSPCISREKIRGETRVYVTKMTEETYALSYESQRREETKNYGHLDDLYAKAPSDYSIGKPLFINPCSREVVAEVFHDIGRQAGLTLHRHEHSSNCSLEFDWVWLQPGPGHIEMNMLRSFVKMMWEPFWGVVEIFNFKSENAKRAARNVTDHHKGMAMASIICDAMAMELVIPYVRKELENGHPEISVAGYMNYVMEVVKSETYAFIADAVFEFLDAIFAYRSGSRYSGEGADFKMEEVNRGVQQLLPAVPHDEDWIRACVNHAHLLNLRQACFDEMNVLDPRDEIQQKVPCINQQVDAVRALIQERRYLSAPEQEDRVKALNGDPLDQDLKNLASKARLKKK
ncbi:hypothetical protein CAPTEDRAFT_203827 [Capitella teleta]|uniref:Uncharacterized protein n=1 Tax=Capitella teleta TaxID=283909 RepID=R7T803_CAPTE|nr:hypothetical protein CAPTEDRAFT_203827 [Capitella teleta]|eukprot:ELT89779.1 hypothetical protein CAPTEDRAFT_203827 [Capitella teleta]